MGYSCICKKDSADKLTRSAKELSKDDEIILNVKKGKVYIEIFPKEKNNMIPDYPNSQIAIIWSIEEVK